MSPQMSTPGIYIDETSAFSADPEISVSTSVTAFVGRTAFGPVEEPVRVFNFEEFQRLFGGLKIDCPLSYAVQDFFENRGAEALIVRLFEPSSQSDNGIATLNFPDSELVLEAANPGQWGNKLSVKIDRFGITEATANQFSIRYNISKDDLFHISVTLKDRNDKIIASERFLNLAVKTEGPSGRYPNRIDRVLDAQSNLIRVSKVSKSPPQPGSKSVGVDGNDGAHLTPARYVGNRVKKTGLYSLEEIPQFNLLCIPPDKRLTPDMPYEDQNIDPIVRAAAAEYCGDRRAFYVIDTPAEWAGKIEDGSVRDINTEALNIAGSKSEGDALARNAAVFFPRIWKTDNLQDGKISLFDPCGAVAGRIAATDAAGGVWKAPAGADAALANISKFEVVVDDDQTQILTSLGINALRSISDIGPVIWRCRTIRGADAYQDVFKYIPTRRLALHIQNILVPATRWAVFEPNNETLWSSLRLNTKSFLSELAQQGAFYDYDVRCDATNNTAQDILNGIVNIEILISPETPNESIMIHIEQAGLQPHEIKN